MTQEKTKYCHSCGAMIPYYDRYCPACNTPQPTLHGMLPIKQEPKKKVWLAVLLSLLITGLGQFYLGSRTRAVVFFGGTLLVGAIMSYGFAQEQIMTFGVIMALVSAYDAYQLALKIRTRNRLV
jgi:TM2 domain-containing membrane protein YozV